jgi:hypothetical protein
MTIIKPDSLPRLWWLFPWSMARQLHKNAVALRQLTDKLDAEVTALRSSREHWVRKYDRAYEVAMHNERVIREMEERRR